MGELQLASFYYSLISPQTLTLCRLEQCGQSAGEYSMPQKMVVVDDNEPLAMCV